MIRLVPTVARIAIAGGMLTASVFGAATPSLASGLPDLTMSIAAASSVSLGKTVDVTVTMTNIGAVFAQNAHFHATFSGGLSPKIIQQPAQQASTCSIDNGTDLVCPNMALGPNDKAAAIVRVTAPGSPGTISVSTTADHSNLIQESNESNNTAKKDITVFRLPDLRGTITSGPTVVSGGAHVDFNVKVDNLGGSANKITLRFGDTNGLVYDAVSFVGNVAHGFSCELHNPSFDNNYVTCSGGSLGDPNVAPSNDESVTLKIGAKVKDRGLTSKDRTVTLTVDQNHTIAESNETNNTSRWDFHYN